MTMTNTNEGREFQTTKGGSEMTNHNTNEGSKFRTLKGGIEMTNTILHNKINASIKILGGLALGALLITALALPITANADAPDRPLSKAIRYETSDVGPYEGMNSVFSSVAVSGAAKVTGAVRYETSDVGPYEDMLPIAKKVIRWESTDMDPFEVLAPEVTKAIRLETSEPDAYES